MTDPYENLSNTIILQAVKDYCAVGKKLIRNPKNKDAKLMIEDCERFFCSDWFSALTSVDGRRLLQKLQEELS